jgi:hypothetical protein
MNENLASMIKSQRTAPPSIAPEELDLPSTPVEEIPAVSEEQAAPATSTVSGPAKNFAPIANLTEWFERNHEHFTNISRVRLSLKGVDSSKTLVFTVSTGVGDARELKMFEDADVHPIVDLPGIKMDSYKHGFGIVEEYKGEFFGCYLKNYIIRTGLIVSLCKIYDGILVPYATKKVKKSDDFLEVQDCPYDIPTKMASPLSKETLMLLYKQSSKVIDSLNTTGDAIKWLVEKQVDIMDVNHHLQIDFVIIELLK